MREDVWSFGVILGWEGGYLLYNNNLRELSNYESPSPSERLSRSRRITTIIIFYRGTSTSAGCSSTGDAQRAGPSPASEGRDFAVHVEDAEVLVDVLLWSVLPFLGGATTPAASSARRGGMGCMGMHIGGGESTIVRPSIGYASREYLAASKSVSAFRMRGPSTGASRNRRLHVPQEFA